MKKITYYYMGEGYRKSLIEKLKQFFPQEKEEKFEYLLDVKVNHMYISRELNKDSYSKEIYSVDYSLSYSYNEGRGKLSLPKMEEGELIRLIDIIGELRVETFLID